MSFETDSEWQKKVKQIASSEGTANDKFDAISLYALHYPITEEEMDSFLTDIVNEYEKGRYLADPKNDKYMLTNLFKSQAIDSFNGEDGDSYVEIAQLFAYGFWMNSLYVYGDLVTADSEDVTSNEEVLDKWLPKLQEIKEK